MADGFPISLRESLDASTFDDLLQEQDPFGQAQPVIDMCWLSFITPTALVQLASMCHTLASLGKRPVLRFMDRRVWSYLLRMQFVEAVCAVADFKPSFHSADPERLASSIGGNPVVLEVTRIQRSEDVQEAVTKILRVLQGELGYAQEHALDVAIAVSEIGQNIYQHNDGVPGFVAMQAYQGQGRRRLEVGISDAGVGLAATLNRNRAAPKVRTDRDAVQRATEVGASEFDDSSRGRGLPLLVGMIGEQGGTVRLRSGSGIAQYRKATRRSWDVPHLAGVHVSLILPEHLT